MCQLHSAEQIKMPIDHGASPFTSMLTPHPEVALAIRIVNRDSGNKVVVFTCGQGLIDLHRQRSVIAITQFDQIEVSFLNRGFVGSFS